MLESAEMTKELIKKMKKEKTEEKEESTVIIINSRFNPLVQCVFRKKKKGARKTAVEKESRGKVSEENSLARVQ